IGIDRFKAIAGIIMRSLRSAKKMPGEERIFTAGEKEYDAWMTRKDKGAPVDQTEQAELLALRERYSLSNYIFPFEK
ncbi:MAG TPA: Ldh family oxidoreductase, partial [Spirochaetota bacterium]